MRQFEEIDLWGVGHEDARGEWQCCPLDAIFLTEEFQRSNHRLPSLID